MSIESKLNYLSGTKDAIREAIQEKGVSIPADTTFRQYADKIRSIETGGANPPDITLNLQEKNAIPTGKDFEVTPDELYDGLSRVTVLGDPNLKPENIAAGITIYGITGILGVAPEYGLVIPSVYQPYFNKARELYSGDYKNVMILESDLATAVGFMLDGFTVKSYDDTSTEFTAIKWVYVALNKQTQVWKVEEHIDAVSGGNTFIKNIRFSDTYIYYGNRIIYPFISSSSGELSMSWEEIADTNGVYCPVGSFKSLTIGTIDGVNYGTVKMEKVYSGENGTTSTWLSTILLAPRPLISSTTTKTYVPGGWAVTELREWLNGTFFSSLIPELKNSIKQVNKYSRMWDDNEEEVLNDLTQDKIWVPSTQEIINKYETLGVYYPNQQKVRYKRLENDPGPWWLRSFAIRNSDGHKVSLYIRNDGNIGTTTPNEKCNISFGFCL